MSPFQYPGTIRRPRSGAVLKREGISNNRPPKTSGIRIVSATKSGSVLTVEYDQALVPPKGLVPQYTTDVAGAEPVSAVFIDPMTIEITFSASIAAATVVNIPYEEPAVRNSIGGYVADSTFPVT
jgi:hypothetical protein